MINVETQDGKEYVVNPDTGEILSEYVTVIVPPHKVKEETKHFTDSLMNPATARNSEEIDAFVKATVDKRKLITINNIRHYHDINCGEVKRNGTEDHFSVTSYKIMTKLVNALTIHNCILCTTEELAAILGCDVSNVKRTLSACKSLVRYQGGRGMQKGFTKVFVCPAYGWKSDSSTAYTSQQQAIYDWYKVSIDLVGDIAPTSNLPESFEISSGFDKWLLSFSKRLKPFKDSVYEEQAEAYFKVDDKK